MKYIAITPNVDSDRMDVLLNRLNKREVLILALCRDAIDFDTIDSTLKVLIKHPCKHSTHDLVVKLCRDGLLQNLDAALPRTTVPALKSESLPHRRYGAVRGSSDISPKAFSRLHADTPSKLPANCNRQYFQFPKCREDS